MTILPYLLGSWCALGLANRSLKKPLEEIAQMDPDAVTPAYQINDGQDFTPAHKVVLFGHHWMSICGTTAIMSSIIGLVWGWVPSLLWMILGSTFIGAANDYYSLMISAKNGAKSLSLIAQEKIDKKVGVLIGILYMLIGMLVVAIFLTTLADTLMDVPDSTVPIISLIPIAILFGIYLRQGSPLLPTTAVFTVILVLICIFGSSIPITLSAGAWITIFAVYTFFAISLPVWLLLTPRDYLNTSLVLGGITLAGIALIVARPAVRFPAFVGFTSIRGPVWPMLLATITCGAASGSHSMVCSGTTVRQLSSQKHAWMVAYGGMQGETFIAGISAAMIMTMYSYEEYLERAYDNAGAAFSNALGTYMTYLGIDASVGTTIGALTFSALLLTTLDSWGRVGRYEMENLLPRNCPIKKNVWVSTGIFMAISLFLMLTMPVNQMWSGFAIGSLTLLGTALSILLIERVEEKKKFDGKFIAFVALPYLFVEISSIAAIIYQLYTFLVAKNWVSFGFLCFMTVMVVLLIYYTAMRIVNGKKK